MKKIVSKIFAMILALAVVISGFTCVPATNVKADEGSDPAVRFVEVQKETFEQHLKNKTYPTYAGKSTDGNSGWFFAGYFTTDGKVIDSIEDADISGENITAKFVSSNYVGITCQTRPNPNNTTKTDLRVISAVHGTNYKAVGFNLYKRTESGDEHLCSYTTNGNDNVAQGTTVYRKLRKYTDDTNYEDKSVAQVFGIPNTSQEAEKFYFTTAIVRNISEGKLGTAIIIKPYWITMDGSVVEGMGEIDRANDLTNEIVNVSVNLTNAKDIAAGMLDVEYNTADFTLIGSDYYDYGRVFEEFQAASYLPVTENDTTGTVRCVGNVSDMGENSNTPNDVYVNLRFQKTDTNVLEAGEAIFSVIVREFCDTAEENKTVSAWDIKY